MSEGAGAIAASTDAAAASRTVLFDFDGVLIRGDSFAAFVRARYRRAPWRLLFAVPLVVLAGPLALSGRGRWWIVRRLVEVSLLGVGEARYREHVRAFAREHAERPRSFLREGIRALRRHLADGDRVVVVTGCEQHLARDLFAAIGLEACAIEEARESPEGMVRCPRADRFELVASRLRPGWFGLRSAVHCFGVRKPRELAARGVAPPWAVAYTDSPADAPMLREAADAVLVNGTPGACRALERALGRSVRRVEWW